MNWGRLMVFPSVRPRERPALGYFFLLLFLVGVGLAIGQGVANTLFLKRFGVSYLPWIYLAQGVGLALASFFYIALSDRVRPERLLNGVLWMMAILLLALWCLTQTPWSAWAHPSLYLLQLIASEILAMHFTLYIGSHFDAEQSKRLLPLAMAGSQLGEVCGGLLLALGAPVVGTANMMLVWLVTGVAALALLRVWHVRHGPTQRRDGVRRGGGHWKQALHQIQQGIGFARESTLLRNTLLAIFYTVISLYMVSYLIKESFVEAYPHADDLAIVFGMVTFVGGSVSFLAQTLLTTRLISRFGVRAANLVFPVSTLIAAAAFLTPWSLFAAFVGAGNRRVLLPAVRNPVRGLMWQALPDYMQGRARGLSLAIVAPLAMLIAGLLVEILRNFPGGIAGMGFAVALLAWHFSRRGNRAYMDAIVDTLKERLFVPRDDLASMNPKRDSHFFAELASGLDSNDEALAEGFGRMLVEHFGATAVPAILQRMDRASLPCRDRFTQLVAPHVTADHAVAWLARLPSCDSHGQATLLGVAFRARWAAAQPHVARCLASDNPRLLACGILGGYCYEDAALRQVAATKLQAMLNSGDVPAMIAAMQMMAVLPRVEFRPLLCEALNHAHARLLTHALQALDAMGQVIVEPQAAQRLAAIYRNSGDQSLRLACVQACRLLPMPARIEILIAALDDPQPQVQRLSVQLLRAQDAASIEAPLIAAMQDWTVGVRGQHAALPLLADLVPFAHVRTMALDYLDRACRYLDWLPDVAQASESGKLLALVLTERVAQLSDLGLCALALGPDRATVEVVRAAIATNDRRPRMRCLDLLEDYADADVRQRVRRLLQQGSEHSGRASMSDIVAALAGGKDAWLGRVAQQLRMA